MENLGKGHAMQSLWREGPRGAWPSRVQGKLQLRGHGEFRVASLSLVVLLSRLAIIWVTSTRAAMQRVCSECIASPLAAMLGVCRS
jgi:hypothetical protein